MSKKCWGDLNLPTVYVCVCVLDHACVHIEVSKAGDKCSWDTAETWVIGAKNSGDLALQLGVLHSLVSLATLVGLNNVIHMLRRPPSLSLGKVATCCKGFHNFFPWRIFIVFFQLKALWPEDRTNNNNNKKDYCYFISSLDMLPDVRANGNTLS